MKKVSIKDIENLECFRDAIRQGEDTVIIYPQFKWNNPKRKNIVINNKKEK